MAGSNIFVMYTSADGQNVTVSPRLGTGHVEPQHDTTAQIEMLGGSGVSNGMMTANVRCSNCNSWQGGSMDFTGSSANWIHAYKSGDPLNSDDPAADIAMHDGYAPFQWNLQNAKGGSSVNPFVTAAANTPSASNTTDSGSTMGSGQGFSDSILTAHAVLAGLAFVAFFPFGAILIRVANFTGVTWVHAACQLSGYSMLIAAFGLGIYMAVQGDYLSEHHPIVGIVLFVILFFQPFTGYIHHKIWKKRGTRSMTTYEHLGIGRIAIILGLINGGTGLQLAGAGNGAKIAYGVCAGVVGVAYLAAIVFGEMKRRRNPPSYDAAQSQHSRSIGSREESADMREHFSKPAGI